MFNQKEIDIAFNRYFEYGDLSIVDYLDSQASIDYVQELLNDYVTRYSTSHLQ
jgi:hypothetical protein